MKGQRVGLHFSPHVRDCGLGASLSWSADSSLSGRFGRYSFAGLEALGHITMVRQRSPS